MKTMFTKTILKTTAPTALLLAALLAGCSHGEGPHTEVASGKTVQATTIAVTDGAHDWGYVVSGTVMPVLDSTLSAKTMGRVTSVAVREGDRVTKGQVLIEIDARELDAAKSMAAANLNSARVGVDSAATAVTLEEETSQARIEQAESQLKQAQAALAAAKAQRDLVMAGPRTQEVSQAQIAVAQAKSNLDLAKKELDRTQKLVDDGALPRRELDLAQNRYDVAKGAYDAAVQSESIAKEGSRKQDIKAANDRVNQAEAAVSTAKSGVSQAKAAAMQVTLRKKELEAAKAQVAQSSSALSAADVALSYTRIVAPFDGIVTKRMVDPGAMAGPGVPLMTVEGGGYWFEAAVPEKLLSFLTAGTQIPVSLDALKSGSVSGKVAEIVPQGDATSHTFTVKFGLDGASGLKTGQYGTARIPTGEKQGVEIPTKATWDKEGLHYVFVVNQDGIARLRIVTLGDTFGEKTAVLSGLSAGERIIVSGHDGIEDGDKVEESGS